MRLRSEERELLEIELLTTLIVQIEAYNASGFSGFKWHELMNTVRAAKKLLGLEGTAP